MLLNSGFKIKNYTVNKLFFIITILLLATVREVNAEKFISPKNKNIQYVGRWDKSHTNDYHSYWGGAYFTIKFRGNQVKIKLAFPVNIYVKLDDGPMVLFTKVSGWVKISPDSLSQSTHHLQVIAKFQDDEIQLEGLSLDENGKLLKPAKKKVLVEFIGDSITSGDRTSKGNTSAYPWICGEALDVKHTQISYCGIPLTDGYHFNYKDAPETGMELAYLRLKQPNHQPDPHWNFKKYTPKVIVINLGTNDASLGVPPNLFREHYTRFIQSIRTIFPKAIIAVLIPFNGSYQNEIRRMVQKDFAGDQRLKMIETNDWLMPSNTTDGTHPNDEGHVLIANKLSGIIKVYLKSV